MFNQQSYHRIANAPTKALLLVTVTILFTTGITFTFVIPGLKGFSLYQLFVALYVYYLVANIFVGLYKGRVWFIFLGTLVLSSLGMGWRIWLEWGEYSLVEHMNPVVLMGYPFIVAFIITLMYVVFGIYAKESIIRQKH